MTRNGDIWVGDPTPAGRTGGVPGWSGAERRKGERRVVSDGKPGGERRSNDRRRAQYCHSCGNVFTPTATHKRTCPGCRYTAMRKGAGGF